MADPAIDTPVKPIRALHAEFLRHCSDIDVLFRRACRDRNGVDAVLVALSAVADALGQLDRSLAAVEFKPDTGLDKQTENERGDSIDHELSDALERMPDPRIQEIFVRRLAELGHRTRMSEAHPRSGT